MTKKLEGKTLVITSGTEWIGLAAAELFVKESAYVLITEGAFLDARGMTYLVMNAA